MPAPSAPSHLLLLTPQPDSGLAASLAACCPTLEVVQEGFQLDRWLDSDFRRSLAGVVVDSDAISLADLRLLAHVPAGEAPCWLLLLVGDRGIAGFEEILDRPRCALLPRPWTPAGLQRRIRMLQGVAEEGHTRVAEEDAYSAPFLDGMVEALKDPLTSISGYLQLLEGQDKGQLKALIAPALDATSQIAAQLEFLQLATAELTPHIASTDLDVLIEDLIAFTDTLGHRIDLELEASLRVDADARHLRAAMKTAFLLLHRFGSGEPIALELRPEEEGVILRWRQAEAARAPQHPIEVPEYLSQLFTRLAHRSGGREIENGLLFD